VDDSKFEQDFSLLDLDTGQRKKLANYMLARLECDLSGRACDPDTDPASIEHVLPENPSDEWADQFPEEYWESSIYRLGNLTLLESSANRRVGNLSYSDKLDAYPHSAHSVTRRITEVAPERWTPELLSTRQRELAARARHTWGSEFA
jgi:hypothetical protein